MKFKNDSGRSMMEMILYLGLIVVLTASTLKMYADSVEKTRVVKLNTQIDDMREYVNTYYLGRNLPASDWSRFKNDIGGETKFADPWGGKLTISTGKIDTETIFSKANFAFEYKGSAIDVKRCISIGNTFLEKDVFALVINSAVLSGENLTISKVAENCTKSSDNLVQGYFYKD